MTNRLDGVRALVTGAGGGVGGELVARLLAEGASVVPADLAAPTLPDAAPGIALDVTDDDSCAAAVESAVERLGGLDLLVNAAGVMVRKDALATDTATWQGVLDVNLSGVYRMSRAAFAPLAASDRAAIVSISSTHAFLAAKNSIAYSVSKAGVSHLTRLLALEWAEHRIRVNAVAPTVVPSPMTADVLADPAYLARKFTAIPLGEPIPAAAVAGAVAYLASPDAAQITGQVLVLDGGESLP
ncbi:SDR family NAD(P)-dependent oxidoreductase [Agromyces sp. SYSU T00194]|uniref:SDR family NAD(P)-dependent oxidoreductase n=1 Tax=Agromyces chitinivorans TaxID=3158560 RepID=UPI00339583D9